MKLTQLSLLLLLWTSLPTPPFVIIMLQKSLTHCHLPRPYFIGRLAAPFRAEVHHGRFGWRRINGVQFFSSFLFPLIAARFRQRRFASRGYVRRKVDRSMRKTLVVIAAHLVDSSGKLENEELSVMNETSQFITIVK